MSFNAFGGAGSEPPPGSLAAHDAAPSADATPPSPTVDPATLLPAAATAVPQQTTLLGEAATAGVDAPGAGDGSSSSSAPPPRDIGSLVSGAAATNGGVVGTSGDPRRFSLATSEMAAASSSLAIQPEASSVAAGIAMPTAESLFIPLHSKEDVPVPTHPLDKRWDIFVSYYWGEPPAHLLKKRALTIVAALREAGYSVWVDVDDMELTVPGNMELSIMYGIRRSSVVLLAISDDYALRPRLRTEATFASKSKKQLVLVNVGSHLYDPNRYDRGNEAEIASREWLSSIASDNIWFDFRAPPGTVDPPPSAALKKILDHLGSLRVREHGGTGRFFQLPRAAAAGTMPQNDLLKLEAIAGADAPGAGYGSSGCSAPPPRDILSLVSRSAATNGGVVGTSGDPQQFSLASSEMAAASLTLANQQEATLSESSAVPLPNAKPSFPVASPPAVVDGTLATVHSFVAAGIGMPTAKSVFIPLHSEEDFSVPAHPPEKQWDIFFSYYWGEPPAYILKKRALTIVAALREAGYSVWLDDDDMALTVPGNMELSMMDGVRRSSIVLLAISDDYALRPRLRTEATFASKSKKQLVLVNVGSHLYDPNRYDRGNEAEIASREWLSSIASDNIWFDFRAPPGTVDPPSSAELKQFLDHLGSLRVREHGGTGRFFQLPRAAAAVTSPQNDLLKLEAIAGAGVHGAGDGSSGNSAPLPRDIGSLVSGAAATNGGVIGTNGDPRRFSLASSEMTAASFTLASAAESRGASDLDASSAPVLLSPQRSGTSPAASAPSPSVAPPAPKFVWEQLVPDFKQNPMSGGTGIVFKATYLPKKRTARPELVAVKMLQIGRLSRVAFLDGATALDSEAATLALLADNRYVSHFFGTVRGPPSQAWLSRLGSQVASVLGPNNTLLGLVMRWEDGGSLADLLHSPDRSWGANTAARLRLCADICNGLACLHDGVPRIVHGDIKPDNVLLSDRTSSPCPILSDFGLSAIRTIAASSTAISTANSASFKCGTYPYMAPEILAQEDPRTPLAAISRTSDIYAVGTLIWEVLCNERPWPVSEAHRILAAWRNENLPLEKLPLDTPESVRELLRRCLSRDRGIRPKAQELVSVLDAATQKLESGLYDVFLSHAWTADDVHAPLTTQVYNGLRNEGFRVWIDSTEMGHDMVASMQEGIRSSGCIVALLSERYASRPNCLNELRWARGQGKRIIACLAEPNLQWFPAAGSELLSVLGGTNDMFPDLRPAACVNWIPAGVDIDVPSIERAKLTKAPLALPKVLSFVRLYSNSGGAQSSTAAGAELSENATASDATADGFAAPVPSSLPILAPPRLPIKRNRLQEPVYCRVSLISLDRVDTDNQVWTGDVYFEFIFSVGHPSDPRWPGPEGDAKLDALREQANDNTTNNNISMGCAVSKIFWPTLLNVSTEHKLEVWLRPVGQRSSLFFNLRSEQYPEASERKFYSLSYRLKSEFAQRFYFASFPVDCQVLKVRLSTSQSTDFWRFSTRDDNRKFFFGEDACHKILVNKSLSSPLVEWQLHDDLVSVASLSPSSSSRTQIQYGHLTLLVAIKRKMLPAFFTLVLPIFIMTSLTPFLFLLRWDTMVVERIGLGIALLIGILSFKCMAGRFMPRVANVTIIDFFLFAGAAFIGSTTVASSSIGHFPAWLVSWIAASTYFLTSLVSEMFGSASWISRTFSAPFKTLPIYWAEREVSWSVLWGAEANDSNLTRLASLPYFLFREFRDEMRLGRNSSLFDSDGLFDTNVSLDSVIQTYALAKDLRTGIDVFLGRLAFLVLVLGVALFTFYTWRASHTALEQALRTSIQDQDNDDADVFVDETWPSAKLWRPIRHTSSRRQPPTAAEIPNAKRLLNSNAMKSNNEPS